MAHSRTDPPLFYILAIFFDTEHVPAYPQLPDAFLTGSQYPTFPASQAVVVPGSGTPQGSTIAKNEEHSRSNELAGAFDPSHQSWPQDSIPASRPSSKSSSSDWSSRVELERFIIVINHTVWNTKAESHDTLKLLPRDIAENCLDSWWHKAVS